MHVLHVIDQSFQFSYYNIIGPSYQQGVKAGLQLVTDYNFVVKAIVDLMAWTVRDKPDKWALSTNYHNDVINML